MTDEVLPDVFNESVIITWSNAFCYAPSPLPQKGLNWILITAQFYSFLAFRMSSRAGYMTVVRTANTSTWRYLPHTPTVESRQSPSSVTCRRGCWIRAPWQPWDNTLWGLDG